MHGVEYEQESSGLRRSGFMTNVCVAGRRSPVHGVELNKKRVSVSGVEFVD